ncbi:biotin transporter BioY [Amaricoccus sp.]|uniref:biotin transporter BioY n=1 Tax=Amaricoccus sp. TaxID=1872485 RepID=UPI001B401D8E|nr:biotin transporter BioY [Amaricoccus sp.]MBP7002969.1 biotin transporter BioY [Amaricoccus sp.]
MADTASRHVLTEAIWPARGAGLWVKRAVLVVAGILALTIAAKIKVPVWPSPVAISLGTFAVLTIGAAYGPRLGLVTMLGWLGLGAVGADVFQNSASGATGIAYMMGATGGYLVGYLLATLALGFAARRGLDRSIGGMAVALLVGNALIYIPGLVWLHHLVATGLFDPAKYASVWDQTLAWGLTPFLIGDALKLALAALAVPALWRLVGDARA